MQILTVPTDMHYRHERQCDWSFVKFMEVEDTWEIMKNVLLDTVNKNTTIIWRRKPRTLPFMIREINIARNKKKNVKARKPEPK